MKIHCFDLFLPVLYMRGRDKWACVVPAAYWSLLEFLQLNYTSALWFLWLF